MDPKYANQTRRVARSMAHRLRLAGVTVDAEDLVQESLLEQLRGRKSVSWPMVDYLRKQGWIGQHRCGRDNPVRVQMPSLGRESHEGEVLRKILAEELLELASPLNREAIRLRYFEEMGEAELAATLNTTVVVVRGRVWCGLNQIRRRLARARAL